MKYMDYRLKWKVFDEIDSYKKQHKVLNDFFDKTVKESSPIMEKLTKKASIINVKAYIEQKKNVEKLKDIYRRAGYEFENITANPIKQYYNMNFVAIDTKDPIIGRLKAINKSYKRTYKETSRYLDLIESNIKRFDKKFGKTKSGETKEL